MKHKGVTAMFDRPQAFVGAIHDLNWYKVAITSEADAKRLQLGKSVRFRINIPFVNVSYRIQRKI